MPTYNDSDWLDHLLGYINAYEERDVSERRAFVERFCHFVGVDVRPDNYGWESLNDAESRIYQWAETQLREDDILTPRVIDALQYELNTLLKAAMWIISDDLVPSTLDQKN